MAEKTPRVPPRWFVRTAWVVHRQLYRLSGGRFGLTTPKPGRYGMLRLVTVGRRSGQERVAIVAYFEDGPDLVSLAMNGWAEGAPAWWLNLQAQPEVTVTLKDGPRAVRARAAHGEERERLWALMASSSGFAELDGLASLRSTDTAVVVFEPR